MDSLLGEFNFILMFILEKQSYFDHLATRNFVYWRHFVLAVAIATLISIGIRPSYISLTK